MHHGLTSSDVLDTATGLQIAQAGAILVAGQRAFRDALAGRAREHVDTLCVGRTHGVHAEPTTFGVKLAGFALEAQRNLERLQRAVAGASVGALSGAVGTYAANGPELEAVVLERLGLEREDVSTQVVARDRHAELLSAVALAGAGLERFATEIRHLQRTEVREVEEPFRAGQKGSSAMPHKRNPITTERLTGIARLLRGYAQSGLENVALWHERDISHSSVERVALPDATILLDYGLSLGVRVVEGMTVHADRMRANLDLTHGALFSQRALLALVESGRSRDDAYRIVQENAQRAWDTGTPFRELLAAGGARAGPGRRVRPRRVRAPRGRPGRAAGRPADRLDRVLLPRRWLTGGGRRGDRGPPQLARRPVPVRGLLGHGRGHHLVQLAGAARARLGRLGRRLGDVGHGHRDRARAGKRQDAGQRPVEQRAERVDVGGGPHLLALDLLGRGVADRAQELAGGGDPALGVRGLGQAEVAQVGVR